MEAPSFGASVEALLTLDDLDDLLGQVAAAARPRSIRLLVDRSEIPDLE